VVFDDPAFVDTGGPSQTGGESDNVQASLAYLGHTVSTFTGIDAADFTAALAGQDVLLIPELENGDLGAALSPAAKIVIAEFVAGGGGLIIHGRSIYDANFLNEVFEFATVSAAANGSNVRTARAVGTAFEGGPTPIPFNNTTNTLVWGSLPAGSSIIYNDDNANATVALMFYGLGQVVYLGWDWDNAAPVGSQDGGWLTVLDSGVHQVLFPITEVELPAVDSGWYNVVGYHNPDITNYIVGNARDTYYRDFFVFDLSNIDGHVVGATLSAYNPSGGFSSADPSETLTLYDVTTPISMLRAGGTGLTAVYADLGGGTSYGSTVVTSASNDALVDVLLNPDGLGAADAARGSSLAVGGTITTLDSNPSTTEMLFGSTNDPYTRTLTLATVPRADVAVTKTVTPTVAGPGQAVTYTLVYSNAGPQTAPRVFIVDEIPDTLTDLEYTDSGPAVDTTGSISYTWRVLDLAPDAVGTITVRGIVSPTVTGVFSLTNEAAIAANAIDENLGNNTWMTANTVDAAPPSTPALRSPAHGALISDTTPTLTWWPSYSPDLRGYMLDWNGTEIDVGVTTQYTTPVLADGVYTWTVASYDRVFNLSDYPEPFSLTVDATPPDTPVLLSPEDGAVISDTTPFLTWAESASPDVAGYLVDWNGDVTDVGPVTQTQTSVLPAGVYTWTVAAYDALHNVSPYAAIRSLTVDTDAPEPPTLVSPANGAEIGDDSPALTWRASPSADVGGYLLNWSGGVMDVGNVTQYVTPILADGVYTWTVAAYDIPGTVGPYTDTWSFTVDLDSPHIVSTEPTGGQMDVAVRASLTITFSEPIAPETFDYTVEPDPGGWSATWTDGGRKVALEHNPFTHDTLYMLTVTTAQDLAGNPLVGAPVMWQFTTGSLKIYMPVAMRAP
jgi:uncharacterized repeat protein (TIGR01451 family)